MFGIKRRPARPAGAAFVPVATADDIRGCFRLLLGRDANPEEWAGHSMQVGRDLGSVVAGYANSLEFARRGLLDRDHAAGIELCEADGFRIHAAVDDAAVGIHVRAGNYEPEVAAVFRRHLRPGMSVIDIGANIGYFTMLSAMLVGPAGHVLAVEPNPRNARLLEASRRVNGFTQVSLAQVAAGREIGLLVLHRTYSNATTSAAPDDVGALFGSESVGCVPVDLLMGDRRIDFIKVDVEGAEYNALRGCEATLRRCRPTLVSELSPGLMPGISGIDAVGYLAWLESFGYALSVIGKDGTVSAPSGPDDIMRAYAARGTDHIDIVAIAI
jgi:FkbM family methyltransferase